MITHNSTRVIYSWPVMTVCWASRWVTHLACGFIFLLVSFRISLHIVLFQHFFNHSQEKVLVICFDVTIQYMGFFLCPLAWQLSGTHYCSWNLHLPGELCHDWVGWWLAFQCRGLDFILGHSRWDFGWSKWQWDVFYLNTLFFPVSVRPIPAVLHTHSHLSPILYNRSSWQCH